MSQKTDYKLKYASCSECELDKIINFYNFNHKKEEIYKGVDYAAVFWAKRLPLQNKIYELFHLLYLLKQSKSITIKGIAAQGSFNLSVMKNGIISTILTNLELKESLIKNLESKIDNETKNYYINIGVVNIIPTEEELQSNEADYKRFLRFKQGKITQEEYIAEYKKTENENSIEKDTNNSYNDFFSIDNLSKILKYESEVTKHSPKHKNQLLGAVADYLIQQYKYSVFGCQRLCVDFIEPPIEEETEENKNIWEKYKQDIADTDLQLKNMEACNNSTIKVHNKFIYSLLVLLGLIKESEEKKRRSQFIGDCLKAYYKIDAEQKQYRR